MGRTASATVTVETVTPPGVSVDKTCPTTVVAGMELQCTFGITANGLAAIALGSFTDATPSNTTFVSVAASGGLGSICPGLGTPAVGGSGTITCTASVNGIGGPNTQTFTVNLLVGFNATGSISNTACYNPGGIIGPLSLCDTATTTVIPVAVTMRSVSATRTREGVLVRWHTASEIDTLGYNVYRAVAGKRARLNRHIIAAKNHAARYSHLDRTASRRVGRYYVQSISLDGTRTWYGPARVLR